MYRVKVGENLFSEASAPSKKAARQLAAEEAVKELMAEGRLQLNKVRSGVARVPLPRRQKHTDPKYPQPRHKQRITRDRISDAAVCLCRPRV